MKRLVVLGGSSVWTAALIEALRPLPPMALVLMGRDPERLAALVRLAGARLPGWTARASRDRDAALVGADAVLLQIRWGGLAARAEDEAAARALGVPADETLGPAAWSSLRRSAVHLRKLGAAVRRIAPQAWLLNLVNPLGPSTALLHEAHPRTVGVCELPHTTQARAAALLGREPAGLDWEVVGSNHRSFLLLDSADLHALESALGPDGRVAGVSARWIRELGALPTKYHRLVRDPGRPGPSRAAELQGIAARVEAELLADPERMPPSLCLRVTDWYEEGVVPMLRALLHRSDRRVVNVPGPGGLVRECLAEVSPAGITPVPCQRPVPPAVRRWMDRFEAHERAVLGALEQGDATRCHAVDPLLHAVRAAERA